jgi:hypothetical protein
VSAGSCLVAPPQHAAAASQPGRVGDEDSHACYGGPSQLDVAPPEGW